MAVAAVSLGAMSLGAGAHAANLRVFLGTQFQSAGSAALPSLCTEDSTNGCVVALPVGGTSITVASDGEAHFDPFGFGGDTSDGIQLDGLWQADGGAAFKVWQQIPGTNTWVIPACVNGVCENGNVFEPVATWIAPGASWSVNLFQWGIYEPDGSLSDIITIGNLANGTAYISFDSGPNVPEPAVWSLMILGFTGVGLMARRRARAVAA